MGVGLAMIIVMVVMMVLMGGAMAWGALTSLRSRMQRRGSAEARQEPLLDERHAPRRHQP
jgi:type II secretory pathway component PulK